MAKQRPTPEEELLKLIEKGDAGGAVKFKRKRRFALSFGGLKVFKLSLQKKISQALSALKSGLKEPNLKVVNKLFIIISIALLTYSIVDFVFQRPNIKEVYRKSQLIKERRPLEEAPQEVRPFLHYLEAVRRRNIFSPISLKETEEPVVDKKQLQELAQDLSLVGISWDNEKPLAMIEDKKANKTYFLREGETISKFKIDKILKDKVILRYEGQMIELM